MFSPYARLLQRQVKDVREKCNQVEDIAISIDRLFYYGKI